MIEQELPPAVQALAESAMTMAFVSFMPAEPPFAFSPETLCIRIAFSGPCEGSLELAAPRAFGVLLASNMLGCDPDDPEVSERAVDAMKELMNVACGDLLSRYVGETDGEYELGLPAVAALDDPTPWQVHANAHPECVFDAEGHLLVVRVKGGPQ